jgi:hypothetical protein
MKRQVALRVLGLYTVGSGPSNAEERRSTRRQTARRFLDLQRGQIGMGPTASGFFGGGNLRRNSSSSSSRSGGGEDSSGNRASVPCWHVYNSGWFTALRRRSSPPLSHSHGGKNEGNRGGSAQAQAESGGPRDHSRRHSQRAHRGRGRICGYNTSTDLLHGADPELVPHTDHRAPV